MMDHLLPRVAHFEDARIRTTTLDRNDIVFQIASGSGQPIEVRVPRGRGYLAFDPHDNSISVYVMQRPWNAPKIYLMHAADVA
jgi:hypothetical protein